MTEEKLGTSYTPSLDFVTVMKMKESAITILFFLFLIIFSFYDDQNWVSLHSVEYVLDSV